MKTMRKIFVTILAVALVMALAVPAMAAGHTLTINGTHTGHTYQAYQIFDGDLNEEGVLSNIEWGTGVGTEKGAAILTALKADAAFGTGAENEFSACTDAEGVAKVLSGWAPDSKKLDRFAEIVGANLTTTCTESNEGQGMVYTISNLDAGYYLIKDKDETVDDKYDYYTKFMVRVVRDGEVKPKGNVPKVDKTVSDRVDSGYAEYEDAGIGDTVYYKLEGTLPSNYADYESYLYRFSDTLSVGLTFVRIEEAYILHQSNTTTTISAGFEAVTNGQNLNITFADLKTSLPSLLASDKIVIKYSAKVNENAVIGTPGNPNEVKLIFSNNPNGTGEGITPPDKPVVYTFEMGVIKVDGVDNTKTLAGAVFTLYRNETQADGVTINKKYAVVANDKISGWTATEADASQLTSDEYGKIIIKGLDAGTYHLHEVKAPSGYNTLDTDIRITIEPTYENNVLSALGYHIDGMAGSGSIETGIVEIQVRNNAGSTLPSTGGMGTTLFYTIGGLMVAAALILLVTKKRMSTET